MDDSLPTTLRGLLRSGSGPNEAIAQLVDAYARYHAVFVVEGTLFVVALVGIAALLWVRFARCRRRSRGRPSLERTLYASLATLITTVAVLLAVIVAANASNALDPTTGFRGAIGLIDASRRGTADLHGAFEAWLQSGSASVPTIVQDHINARLAWQLPKAIVTTLLLVASAGASMVLWRATIRESRRPHSPRARTVLPLLAAGTTTAACLLLMLMALGNTQAAVAPLSMTLFYG